MDFTDGKSTLVQVMAWCRQATSHYLSQCWLRSLSPYGVIRPQWAWWENMNWLHKFELNCLLNSLFWLTTMKTSKLCNADPFYQGEYTSQWPFVSVMHLWPVDSPHKLPVMWKVFSCHQVIMYGPKETDNHAEFLYRKNTKFYPDCWCPGNENCQGISSHNIDPVFLGYPGLSIKEVKLKLVLRFATLASGLHLFKGRNYINH